MKKSKIFKRLKAVAVGAAMTATALVTPFAVQVDKADAAVSVNYAKALQYSLYLYDANMCGKEVGEKGQLDWRDDCHTYDSSVSTPYGTLDLSGGFHDAGDHVKFNHPGAYSATMLGWGYYEFKDAYTQTGQAAHLQTITDYFCDYFKRCTVMSGSTVQAYCYQVGDGDTDHAKWESPEKQTIARPAYFATSSNPCTDAVAQTAAALAMNYLNFKNSEDLTYAKALYSFAKSNNKAVTISQSYYRGESYYDDLALAAIILYKATSDSSYQSDCANWISQSGYAYSSTWPLCWDNVWPAANALYGKELNRLSENIDSNKNSKATSEGYVSVLDWGSARYNASLQMTGLVYDKYKNSSTYASWAKGQMEYLFGNNKNNQCYMVGYDSNSVTQPHHRAASGYSNFPSENRGVPFKNVLVGALVGGPDKSGNYYDEVDKYEYTEVATDYNACFVGALAGLYLKYGAGQSVASSIPGVSGSTTPVVTTVTTTKVTTTTTRATQTTVSSNKTTTTTRQPSVVTTTTSSVQSGGSGSNKVEANAQIDYSNNKNFDIKLSELIPSGATANKIIVNLTANGDIGTMSFGGGITLSGGNWQSLNGTQNGTGSSVQAVFDISNYANNLEMSNGVFQFSYWWGNQQTITVDSVVCECTGGSSAVVTTKATTATTKATTTRATVAPQVTTPATNPTGSVDTSKLKVGDVDLDGSVNLTDMITLSKYLVNANIYPINATAHKNADCNYNGVVDASDNAKLAEYLLSALSKL